LKTNEELQKDVQDAIKWEHLLHAAEIGVTAKDGVITLTGVVDNYAKKSEAEDAAKNVAGVKAVVEKIEIKFASDKKNDNEIADDIITIYKWNIGIPKDKIKIKVERGWVTLEGEISLYYQKESAKSLIRNIEGVTGVTNNIRLESVTNDKIEKGDIVRALARTWSLNDKDIQVFVAGNKVILTGSVESLYQKNEAGRIAWNAPGVKTIDNELVIA
jgi:osmotically-inducible protein OsmY